MIIKGRVHKYGSNIDTDAIIPAKYLNIAEPVELAGHCLENLDKNFASKVKKGDILVAEENFGCGSSREHAPIAIKEAGVTAVIAKSFARIFYRNALNVGLPVFECPDAVNAIREGYEVVVDSQKGTILVDAKEFKFSPYEEYVAEIIQAGGLMKKVKKELG